MAKPAADEEGMGPLERGKNRYQQKNYSGALEAFTEAISLSTGHLLITALDARAAAYEKLEQLQPALRDAKRIIDLKPELAKGYLRCGKVLQLKEQNELALKIYERGLNKVKIGTDDDRTASYGVSTADVQAINMILQKLQSIFNRLRQTQNKDKCLDPLQFLPIELAEMVCQNLAMRDRVICLAVSPSWKRLLESSHKLWTTLDTSYTRKPVSQRSLRLHLRRSNYTLDRAVVTMKAALDAAKWEYIFRTCKKLRKLEIQGSGFIGDSLTASLNLAQSLETMSVSTNCEISISAVQLALKTCQTTLVEATFLKIKGFRNYGMLGPWPMLESLKTLHFRASGDAVLDIAQLCHQTPNATSVTLHGWNLPAVAHDLAGWKMLDRLDLSNTAGLVSLPKLPPTLRHLILTKNLHLQHDLRDDDDELPALLLLETLDCSATALTGQFIKTFTSRSIKEGNLKRLCIGDRLVEWRGGPVEDEYPASNSVEELSLASLLIWEQRMIEVVKLYPNLRRLDVSGTKVTGVAVRCFVQMGITWLKLDECNEVSTDAVEWARGKGVEVEFNFPSRGAGRRSGFRDRAFAGAF